MKQIFGFLIVLVLVVLVGFFIRGGDEPTLQHEISQEQANKWIEDYSAWEGKSEILSSRFKIDEVQALVEHPEAEYFEIVKGLRNGREVDVLFVTDENGKRFYEVILEKSIPCPPYCGEVATKKAKNKNRYLGNIK